MTSLGYRPEAGAAFSTAAPRALPSPFDGPEGEAAYLAAYDAVMSFWPVPFESLDVPSRFGLTHLVASGPPHGRPLLLLHGFCGALTMWWPNVAELSRTHRVYAVDEMGQPGRSIPDQPITSRAEYVEWLTTLLDALAIERTDVVGMSYGGWLTLSFGVGAPERVGKIVLLSPAAGFLPLVDEFFARSMRLVSAPTRATADDFMRWLAAADLPSDPVLRARYDRFLDQLHLGVAHFRGVPGVPVVPPDTFTDDELRGMRAPTLLLMGDQDPIYDTKAALDRARRLLPSCEGDIVPGAGHMLCSSQAALVDARILAFLDG